jgi:hypothetical protein
MERELVSRPVTRAVDINHHVAGKDMCVGFLVYSRAVYSKGGGSWLVPHHGGQVQYSNGPTLIL